MYCKKCGIKLSENSAFCHICGEPVESSAENQANTQNSNTANDSSDSQVLYAENIHNATEETIAEAVKSTVICPKCGNAYMRMQVQKNVHTSTSDGYSASDGCCGYILFGPLGLLCGVGGNQKTNVTETSSKLWACDNCGNTFRDRDEIKEEYLKVKKARDGCIVQGIVAFVIIIIALAVMLASVGSDAFAILGLPVLLIGIVVPIIFFGIKWAMENAKLEPLRDEFKESVKAYPDGEKELDEDDDDC